MNRFNNDDCVCVIRDGSWDTDNKDFFRALYRYRNRPVFRYLNLGFRCVAPESSPIVQRFVRIK